MDGEPVTCKICGALITERREGELVTLRDSEGPVWVHPGCCGRGQYRPSEGARRAYLSLEDPVSIDNDRWVSLRDVEASRGAFEGSGTADFVAGLEELVEAGLVEQSEDEVRFRITLQGGILRRRLGLK